MAKGRIIIRRLRQRTVEIGPSASRCTSELEFDIVEGKRVHWLSSLVTHSDLSAADEVEVAEPHGYFGPFDSEAFRAAVERFFLVNYRRPRSGNWPLPVIQAFEIVDSDDD